MSYPWLGLLVPTLLVSWALTRWLVHTRILRLLDRPNERSLHHAPTPRTGGLAIVTSFAVGLAVLLSLWSPSGLPAGRLPALLLATLALCGISLIDDWRDLNVSVRLTIQVAIVSTVIVWWGPRVDYIGLPMVGIELGSLATPLTVLAVVWMINLYNFMDGIDGFAGGMSVVGFGFLGGLAAARGVPEVAWPTLLACVAAGGFLIHNWPPARIFMGDVGSVPLGFLAAVLSLQGIERGVFSLWTPILVFSPFVVDATVTLFKRLARGEPVWRAHREHHYQRLVLAGWTHRRTTLAELCVMLAAGLSAVVYEHVTEMARLGVLIAWGAIYAVLSHLVARVEARAK